MAPAMDLRALRYFVAIVDAGSLSKAAAAIHVAQPALTAQVKRLEDELGVQVLDRSHAGVRPTAAGERLYEDAMRLLEQAEALRRRIGRPPGEPQGTVTLGFPALLVPVLAGPLIMRLRERHAGIRLFLHDADSLGVLEAVQDGRADFGLIADPPALPGLTLRPVASEAIYFVGVDADGAVRATLRAAPPAAGAGARPRARAASARPLAKTRGAAGARTDATAPAPEPTLRFGDAVGFPLVLQSRRFAMRRLVQETASGAGLRLSVSHEHDSAAVIRALQRAGAAFTFVPGCAVPVREADPTRIRARVVEPELRRAYALGRLTGRQLDAPARAVAQVLLDVVGEAIDSGRWIARRTPADSDREFL